MNYALIFAGGVGKRMNSKSRPKQFLEIHGKPVLIYTIENFETHPEIDYIALVCVAEWLEYAKSLVEKFNLKKVRWVVPGGETALQSQFNGLQSICNSDIHNSEDIVLIHDGVRPLVSRELISRCIDSVREHGSAITVAPAIETIIRSDKIGCIKDTFPRSECQLARAPQCFHISDILNAHLQAQKDNRYDFVDSTSLMLHYGFKLHTVEGPTENIKVTNPADFYICRALMDAREDKQIYGI